MLQCLTLFVLLKLFLFVKDAVTPEQQEEIEQKLDNTGSFGLNDELENLRQTRFSPQFRIRSSTNGPTRRFH